MERKVLAGGGIGLAVSVVLIWIFQTMQPTVAVPGEVAGAFGAICTWAFSWLIPNPK